MKEAIERLKEKIHNQFLAECEEISDECMEEGYPSTGYNYDLRVADLEEWYDGEYGYIGLF